MFEHVLTVVSTDTVLSHTADSVAHYWVQYRLRSPSFFSWPGCQHRFWLYLANTMLYEAVIPDERARRYCMCATSVQRATRTLESVFIGVPHV